MGSGPSRLRLEMRLHDSPLRALHERYVREDAMTGPPSGSDRPGAAVGRRLAATVEYIPYGQASQIISNFGDVEREYAAIRRGAGLLDSAHRGTLMLTGSLADRRDFLNRMLTQQLKDLALGDARQAFWLNRAGRIQADLFVIELGDKMLVDVDIHQAASAVATLQEFLVAEDIAIQDVSEHYHHIAIHGPDADRVIARQLQLDGFTLDVGHGKAYLVDSVEVVVARRDQTGGPGLELIVPVDKVEWLWQRLLASTDSADVRRVRPIGWHAYNIARIEAGTPLFNIDFGPTNLPHETAILSQRVSFTKGCYLGQEIVARMENLGRPKQTLFGLRIESDSLPVDGSAVYERQTDGAPGEQIGLVTSSTLSPMLGAMPVAFAMLKTAKAGLGNTVLVDAEGQRVDARITALQFWPAESGAT